MARQITVEILGDSSKFVQVVDKAENASKPLDTTWDRLQDTADQLSASMDTLGKRVQGLDGVSEAADAFGNLERVMLGVNDLMGVLEDQLGVNLGPMAEYGQAAADVAGGMEGIIGGGAALVTQFKNIAPALAPAIAGTWAHVAALTAQAAAFIVANAPILLLVAGIALLAAGVVLLVKNWDDIQPHVQPVIDFFDQKVVPAFKSVWEDGMKPVIDFVTNNWKTIGTLILLPFAPIILIATDAFGIRSKSIEGFNAIVDWMGDTWTTIKDKVTSPFDDLLESAKGAFGLKSAIIGAFEAIPGAISTALSGLMGIVGAIVNPVIDAYNNSVGRVPGVANIPRFGGGGGSSGGGSTATNAQEPGYQSTYENQGAGGGGGGGDGFSNFNTPFVPMPYQDPRGATYTADDMLAARAAIPTGAWDWSGRGGGSQIIQLVVDGAVLAQVVAREQARGY